MKAQKMELLVLYGTLSSEGDLIVSLKYDTIIPIYETLYFHDGKAITYNLYMYLKGKKFGRLTTKVKKHSITTKEVIIHKSAIDKCELTDHMNKKILKYKCQDEEVIITGLFESSVVAIGKIMRIMLM